MKNRYRECLEYMETEEFKAIEIIRSLKDNSSVRFLDETLDEAIKELRALIEDYRVVKKQNDYYNLEGRSCNTCVYKECSNKEVMQKYNDISISEFWCNEWRENQQLDEDIEEYNKLVIGGINARQ